MTVIIRKKERDDCYSIAQIVTLAWQQTYKGIINDDFLNSLSKNEEERAHNLYENFTVDNNNEYVLEIEGKIVGFVKYGETDDIKYPNYGELHSLYIINGYKGYGYGKLLFLKAVEELKKLKYEKMIIGCLEGNPTNDFYKHLGAQFSSTRIFSRGGQDLVENVYTYDFNIEDHQK